MTATPASSQSAAPIDIPVEQPDPTLRVWLVDARCVQRWVTRHAVPTFDWCYLGTSAAMQERIARYLSGGTRVYIGQELNRVAELMKRPFLDWIAAIGTRQRNQARWLASRMASHNPHQSDLFLLLSYAELARLWMTQQERMVIRVCVIEDPWLMWLFRQRYRREGRVRLFAGGLMMSVSRDVVCRCSRIPQLFAGFLIRAIWSLLMARKRSPQEEFGVEPNRSVTLLYTWIDQRSFSPEGMSDPYTGRLADILTAGGQRVKRFTPLQIGIRHGWWRQLRRASPRLIVTSRYLRLRDILASACCWFSITHRQQAALFGGNDCSPLLYRELLREWSEPEFAECQLWYRAVRELARIAGRWIGSVIYPFEHQPWEKMLCLAFRAEAPWVRVIGYQHTTVTSLYLGYALGKGETTFSPLPHHIVTNGPLGLKKLREEGFPRERLLDGGAFRFEHLLTATAHRQRPNPDSKSARVVVALPIAPLPAAALLRRIVAAFPAPFLDAHRTRTVEFIIKSHPRLPLDQLLRPSERLPSWVIGSERSLSELCPTADAFLYTPPSSTGWEAYLHGLPVLKYLDRLHDGALDIDPSDALQDAITNCSDQTLKATLETVLAPASTAEHHLNRRETFQRVFSPVDEQVWVRLTRPAAEAAQGTGGCGMGSMEIDSQRREAGIRQYVST